MELRAFAERVLFATTLDAKLAPPDGPVTDLAPGPAVAPPSAPGRPPELRFKESTGSKSRFPGLHRLEQKEERGKLLHFFANHELLAVELMALVLLRFPDAPSAFRAGVLRTLLDEQDHTRLYVERMRACGIGFGELPVSGFFWRAVSGMQSPMDYVAGLSLTFEQANLDFARHFAHGFREIGDGDSAALLDRIYRDEIAHVAYGLKWFRRWKDPRQSDWDAFCRQLRLPLSPRRAKGFALNVEGRLAAGLDPDFIARLEVHSLSKGRTPSVFLFNPFAEGYVASGMSFAPVKHQAALARDLAHLPMFLAHEDDVVLVPRTPRIEFLATLKHAGLPIPEFVSFDDPDAFRALGERKLGRLRPWAWSPDSVRRLATLTPSVTGDDEPSGDRFSPAIGALYSKAWSAEFLRRFLAEPYPVPLPRWLCPQEVVGVPVDSVGEALEAVRRIRDGGHHRIVVKESLGLAGSNALRLWEPEILATQIRWMENRLAEGRPLVVEPWLDRVFDFSMQLERRRDGTRLVGYTGLVTDDRGQFVANWAAPDHGIRPPSRVAELLRAPDRPADVPRELRELLERVVAMLEAPLADAAYFGPLGVDAFVYRDREGRHRLKPIVEINPRHTMGRLTLGLMRHVQAGSFGCFRIVNRATLVDQGYPDFASYADALSRRHPIVCEGHPEPRLREGAVALSDPAAAEVCLATFRVSRTPCLAPD